MQALMRQSRNYFPICNLTPQRPLKCALVVAPGCVKIAQDEDTADIFFDFDT